MEDERLYILLTDISRDLKKIASLMEQGRPYEANKKKWIDRLDVEKLLGKSESTIRRYTADGTLKPRRIGGKNWYLEADVFRERQKFIK